MIGQILKIISEGRISSVERIADTIGISPQVAGAIIEDLVRRGYLVESCLSTSGGCRGSCGECRSRCRTDGPGIRFWSLA